MHEGENSGLPMIRPLLLHYQDDARTYERNDEFLCGEELLIAPVVEQGAKERLVYLPAGDRWVDYWTKKSYDGGQSIVRETPLDLCPIYIREGSVVPLYPVQQYVGEKEIETLTLDVYPPGAGRTCRYRHYQDDGESFDYRNGTYNLISCEVDRPSEEPFIRVKLNDVCHHYQKGYQSIKFIINGVQASHVSLNDAAVPFEATDGKTIFTVELCGDIGIRY
jgi:alpha-glucosidase